MRTCDVCIPSDQVAVEHLDFSFSPGEGLLIYPRRDTMCLADGRELRHALFPARVALKHGSELQVGEVRLMVRFYEGLQSVPRLMGAPSTAMEPPAGMTAPRPIQGVPPMPTPWEAPVPPQTPVWPPVQTAPVPPVPPMPRSMPGPGMTPVRPPETRMPPAAWSPADPYPTDEDAPVRWRSSWRRDEDE